MQSFLLKKGFLACVENVKTNAWQDVLSTSFFCWKFLSVCTEIFFWNWSLFCLLQVFGGEFVSGVDEMKTYVSLGGKVSTSCLWNGKGMAPISRLPNLNLPYNLVILLSHSFYLGRQKWHNFDMESTFIASMNNSPLPLKWRGMAPISLANINFGHNLAILKEREKEIRILVNVLAERTIPSPVFEMEKKRPQFTA